MCMLLGHSSTLVENALKATCFTYNITFSLLPCFQIEDLYFSYHSFPQTARSRIIGIGIELCNTKILFKGLTKWVVVKSFPGCRMKI